jgi:hypothetical protein
MYGLVVLAVAAGVEFGSVPGLAFQHSDLPVCCIRSICVSAHPISCRETGNLLSTNAPAHISFRSLTSQDTQPALISP